MTEDEFRAFVNESQWKFASTMPNIPHEYTLRKRAANDERFASAVQFIRSNGYDQRFYSKTFVYFNVDDKQYWTMGAAVSETILINRATLTP